MKKLLLSALASSAILLSACAESPEVASTEAGRIREADLYEEMKSEPLQGGMTVGETVLQQMLLQDIFEQSYGDQVTDEEVQQEYESSAKQFGTVEEYEQLLQQQGISPEYVKDNVRMTFLMRAAIRDNVEITDEQIQEEYEANRPDATVQHILVQDEQTANDIITQLEEGADFATLVQKHSMDQASVENDGQITFSEGEMMPPFEEAALNLEVGETTTEPVETQAGFHVIRRNELDYAPLEEQREQVEQSVIDGYMQDQQFMTNLVTDLANEANVQIADEDLQGAMASYMPQEEQEPAGESQDESENTEEGNNEEGNTEEENTEENSGE